MTAVDVAGCGSSTASDDCEDLHLPAISRVRILSSEYTWDCQQLPIDLISNCHMCDESTVKRPANLPGQGPAADRWKTRGALARSWGSPTARRGATPRAGAAGSSSAATSGPDSDPIYTPWARSFSPVALTSSLGWTRWCRGSGPAPLPRARGGRPRAGAGWDVRGPEAAETGHPFRAA